MHDHTTQPAADARSAPRPALLDSPAIRRLLQALSWLACIGTLLPAGLFFLDQISLDQVKSWMLGMAILWFVATPFWMGRSRPGRTA